MDGRHRVIIEQVMPHIDGGVFPIKRVPGEQVEVRARLLCDGHDQLRAVLLHRTDTSQVFAETLMAPIGQDLWRGEFTVPAASRCYYTVEAWVDPFRSWLDATARKETAGLEIRVELEEGARLLDAAVVRAAPPDGDELRQLAAAIRGGSPAQAWRLVAADSTTALMDRWPDRSKASLHPLELTVQVDPPRALFSTWYEIFPRGAAALRGEARHGTFADVERLVPEIAAMGFDVLYLPPIHPIGTSFRKGKNNATLGEAGDVGSPWAIGNPSGGHKSIHAELGTLEDFRRLIRRANQQGLELALDIALQCSPDHPYVQEHPDWFRRRADGSIQYAENPPKKYQDIYPFDFECGDWQALWQELLSIFLFWADEGVRCFRVDNPHTKPLAFWRWCLAEVRARHPETLFLAEAFTRPPLMYWLAKAGFTQSYTYFTWRNTKSELTAYLTELVETAPRDFFRPNFWPNTPDILPEYLQYGGRSAAIIRLVLAATLSSSYGIYGPAFELSENRAVPGKEEYLDSEKYEIRVRDWDAPGNLKSLITLINRIRRENPALHSTWNLRFLPADNDFVLFYLKYSVDRENLLLVAINLDPHNRQGAWLTVPLEELGIPAGQSYLVHDLLGDDRFLWQGGRNYLELDPQVLPARIFRLHTKLRRETDFDYFM